MKKKQKKVAVGLSGGVDSSVSAYLLKEQGYDVTGVHLVCWDKDAGGCTPDENRRDAVKVAYKLEIPFKSLNFEKQYKEKVIDYFYNEYRAGRTPNPDVLCNKEIKFGLFLDWAMKEGYDYVATGHYARVSEKNGTNFLLKGVDGGKDQSYFLYLLTQGQLSKTLFPLGEMVKKDVRKLAKKAGLFTYDKPDSVGICFIGEVDIREFLERQIKPKEGKVVNKKGEVIGTHDGVWFYTIGQRHGFKVDRYVGVPLYVIGKNVEKNELVVGFGKDGLRESFEVSDLHWIGDTPSFPLGCDVRIRHLGTLHECVAKQEVFDASLANTSGSLIFQSSEAEIKKHPPHSIRIDLKEPIFGVAPGQSAVFYKGDIVLGGGIIQ